MKVIVYCPALRVGGGLVVGRNLVEGLARHADKRIQWRFETPVNVGYEEIAQTIPEADLRFCPPVKHGVFSRVVYDAYMAKRLARNFNRT